MCSSDLPNLGYGDAIGNHALWVRDQLLSLGYYSEIFARYIATEMLSQTFHLSSPESLPRDAALIYHHSIGTEVTSAVCLHPGPVALIYHNITPAGFFASYQPQIAESCLRGRAELTQLAPNFRVSVGDSRFNAIELAAAGFESPGVLPICVDPAHWQHAPDEATMAALQDGRTNILFIGRIVPNKRQEDLIFTFSIWLEEDPTARLFLVGTAEVSSLYLECLQELARQLGVDRSVHFVGQVSDAQLHAYYRCASMFWCFSEHEGFCVPLVEAMWFDVPILAYASTAVSETLAGAGCLFEQKGDLRAVAALGQRLLTDLTFRDEVLARQRERRNAFLPEGVRPRLVEFVDQLLGSTAAASSPVPLQNIIDPATVRSIAVVKLDHIGDLVLATPAFAALDRRFPGAKITAVVSPVAAPVLGGNPHVDEVIGYDAPWFWRDTPPAGRMAERLRANAASMRALHDRSFDLVVNLRSDQQNVLFAASLPHRDLLSYTNHTAYAPLVTHPLLRTQAHHACTQHRHLLATIGVEDWSDPVLFPQPADHAAVTVIHEFKPGTVALFTGAGIPLKKWAAGNFLELARRLVAARIPVVLVGAGPEAEVARQISTETGAVNLCSRFTLPQLAAALSRCAVLVSNDSAPVHIAAAMGTPVVYITRPLVREEFAPVGDQHQACCADHCQKSCGGFDPVTRAHDVGTCACIQGIAVADVLSKTLTILGSARAATRVT